MGPTESFEKAEQQHESVALRAGQRNLCSRNRCPSDLGPHHGGVSGMQAGTGLSNSRVMYMLSSEPHCGSADDSPLCLAQDASERTSQKR
eukprot:s2984_g6.t1